MIPDDWIAHRRSGDRELIGWLRPAGDAWVAVSLLGHDLSEPLDWTDAEEVLDAIGLAWLADVWQLDTVDGPIRVRIAHVAPGELTVHTDDFGAIDVPVDRYDLPWPAPPELRPLGGR